MALLFNKDSLLVKKRDRNKYTIETEFSNVRLDIDKILNFENFTILKELNKDLIDIISVNKITNTSASFFILYNHFFKDLGLPQIGMHLNIEKTKTTNSTEFTCSNNESYDNFKMNHLVISFEKLNVCFCFDEDSQNVKLKVDVEFNNDFEILPFVEKLALQIIHKIFLRSKQFIELF